MSLSSNPPPPSSPQRAALTAPYASLAPRSLAPQGEPTTPSTAPSRRTNPTWADTTKARARACKTHHLARRPDGTCMACERERKESRGAQRWLWVGLALALGIGGAWFVSQESEVAVGKPAHPR